MQVLKNILNFHINASVHVALAVYSFLRITEVYFELEHHINLGYFTFFASISGYNFVKYFGIAKFHHRSLTKNLKIIQFFSFICFLLMCYYGAQLTIRVLLLYGCFAILTLLYALPFLSGFQKNLRSISYVKVGVVALVWSGVTVVIPFVASGNDLPISSAVCYAVQRMLLICVLMVPFDIRDMKFDVISFQTIPTKIGVEQTKKMAYVLLLFALVLEFVIAPGEVFRNLYLVMFFMVLFFVMRAKNEQSRYYSSFWVEAIPIIWWLLLAICLS